MRQLYRLSKTEFLMCINNDVFLYIIKNQLLYYFYAESVHTVLSETRFAPTPSAEFLTIDDFYKVLEEHEIEI